MSDDAYGLPGTLIVRDWGSAANTPPGKVTKPGVDPTTTGNRQARPSDAFGDADGDGDADGLLMGGEVDALDAYALGLGVPAWAAGWFEPQAERAIQTMAVEAAVLTPISLQSNVAGVGRLCAIAHRESRGSMPYTPRRTLGLPLWSVQRSGLVTADAGGSRPPRRFSIVQLHGE